MMQLSLLISDDFSDFRWLPRFLVTSPMLDDSFDVVIFSLLISDNPCIMSGLLCSESL